MSLLTDLGVDWWKKLKQQYVSYNSENLVAKLSNINQKLCNAIAEGLISINLYTEAKHLVNPTHSTESANYTEDCSSTAYQYHIIIENISSYRINNLFIFITKKTIWAEEGERERDWEYTG